MSRVVEHIVKGLIRHGQMSDAEELGRLLRPAARRKVGLPERTLVPLRREREKK